METWGRDYYHLHHLQVKTGGEVESHLPFSDSHTNNCFLNNICVLTSWRGPLDVCLHDCPDPEDSQVAEWSAGQGGLNFQGLAVLGLPA